MFYGTIWALLPPVVAIALALITKEVYSSLFLGIVVGAALVVGIFARPILLLFTEDDAERVRIGVFSLRIQCLAMPFHGFGIIVYMLCSGIGRALPSLLLGLARQGICFFPILPIMIRLWGVWGIASVQGAADMLVMLLAVPIAVRVSRDIQRREAEQGGETAPA